MRAALLWLLLTAVWPIGAGSAGTETFQLTLIHLNDHHSHLDPELDLRLSLPEPIGPVHVESGGMDRVAALVRALRARYPDSLVLHAGDALIGTPYDRLFQGEADAAAMRQICFNAFALGNHEFDRGEASLARFIERLNQDPARCRTAVLAANVQPLLATPLHPRPRTRLLQPETVLQVGTERIGIIGLLASDRTRRTSRLLPSTDFQDELSTAQQRISGLKSQGIDKIILLTHQGYQRDLELAARLDGVDAIVGGDSHTLLGEGLERLGLEAAGPYPTIAWDSSGQKVCIVQAWHYAKIVGELHISFDRAGQVLDCTGQPHLVVGERILRGGQDLSETEHRAALDLIASFSESALIQPDPAFKQALAPYRAQIEQLEQRIVAVAAQDLCRELVPGQGVSAICDRRATRPHGGDVQHLVAAAYLAEIPQADVAVLNAGGVRADLPAGPISLASVYRLLPFADTLVVLKLSGAELQSALEEAIAGIVEGQSGGGAYPYAVHLRWALDLSQPTGRRLSALELRDRKTGQWRPLRQQEWVRVVTNSFLARGGDGYMLFKRIANRGRAFESGIEVAQAWIDFLRRNPEPAPGMSGRPAGFSIRAGACADYSTQRLIDPRGRPLEADPQMPPRCRY